MVTVVVVVGVVEVSIAVVVYVVETAVTGGGTGTGVVVAAMACCNSICDVMYVSGTAGGTLVAVESVTVVVVVNGELYMEATTSSCDCWRDNRRWLRS